MSVSLQLVLPDESAAARPRAAAIERHLSRFPAEAQPRLRAFAYEHAWTADLVVSFPALAAAIALAPKNAVREAAYRAVIAGAPLARIAAVTKTALWLRACPPEAFSAPTPRLPDDAEFRRRISNHFPKDWKRARLWFDSIAIAYEVGDSAIALWCAREAPRAPRRRRAPSRAPRNPNLRLVSLFAWMSKHQRIAASDEHALWNADMQWNAARDAAFAWSNAILLDTFVGDRVTDAWFEAACVGDYSFQPLLSVEDIRAEAVAMKNCIRTYGFDLANNERRLWSVRKGGERVATLSLRTSIGFMPMIDELSGPGNAAVDADTAHAAHLWVCAQDARRFGRKTRVYTPAVLDQKRWRAQWRPYWLAKRRIPSWLPLRGSDGALYAL